MWKHKEILILVAMFLSVQQPLRTYISFITEILTDTLTFYENLKNEVTTHRQ